MTVSTPFPELSTLTPLQKIFCPPGSYPASVEEVIEEMMTHRHAESFTFEQVSALVQMLFKMTSFQLEESMRGWQDAVDEGSDPVWNGLRVATTIRVGLAKPFVLPELSEMLTLTPEERQKFLTFSIMEISDAFGYPCGIDHAQLCERFNQFMGERNKLQS